MFEDKFEDKILENMENIEKFPVFPLSININRTENSSLYDNNEKRYIDLTSNNQNNPFGYSIPAIESFNSFIDGEIFISSASEKLEQTLKKQTGLDKAVFSSDINNIYSFVQETIKINLNKTNKEKVLVSCASSNKNFYRIKDGAIDYIPLNQESILKTFFSRTVGAVIIELSQITEDVLIADKDYLTEVKRLCKKNRAVLVFDVSTLSPNRLGNGLLNYPEEIQPDIIIIPKGMGQGIPLSGAILSEELFYEIKHNIKSSIYSPAFTFAMEIVNSHLAGKTAALIHKTIAYMDKKLTELSETHISLVDFYNYGLLYTIVIDLSAYQLSQEAFKEGIIFDTLSDSKIILSPPYNITTEEIDYFIAALDRVFDKLASFDRLK